MEKALGELDRLGITTVHASRDGREHWIEFPLASPAQGDAHGLHVRLFASPDYEVCGDNRGTSKNTLRAQKVPREIGEGHNTLAVRELVHLCQATRSLDALASWNEGLFGMQPLYRTPDGKHPDMATMMLTLPGSGIIWELIAPVGEDSFIDRFLDKRGEAGCHHVTFEVQSWEGAMAACEVHGVPVFGESSGTTDGANWRDAFIHPKHSGGALIQLYWEERPGVWMRSDKISADRKAAWR
jgi:methylmalonyl-CoA/ethylmalonyl-CoA epimerase